MTACASSGQPSNEPNSSHLTIVGYGGGQATLHSGQYVTVDFQIRFVGTETYVDVTNSPNTHYASVPAHAFAANVFCAGAADVGKSFTLYAVYRDPKTGVDTVSTASVSVVK